MEVQVLSSAVLTTTQIETSLSHPKSDKWLLSHIGSFFIAEPHLVPRTGLYRRKLNFQHK